MSETTLLSIKEIRISRLQSTVRGTEQTGRTDLKRDLVADRLTSLTNRCGYVRTTGLRYTGFTHVTETSCLMTDLHVSGADTTIVSVTESECFRYT